jgi:hypothetical protein
MKLRNVVVCLIALSCTGMAFAASAAADPLAQDVRAGLNAAAMAKLAVSEHYIQHGAWPGTNEAAGVSTPSNAAADVAIGQGGVVTVTYRTPAALAGKSIVMTPSAPDAGTVNWTCRATGIPADALPAHCR